MAGRIDLIRSGKGYLAAHSTWENPDADTSCPLCSEAPQTFEHAILSCPLSAHQRSCLLQRVSDLAPEAPLWSDQQLLIALAEFIRTLPLAFPPRCLCSPVSSIHLYQIRFSPLPPYPPLALETRWWLYTFLCLASARLRRLFVTLGDLVMLVSLVDR